MRKFKYAVIVSPPPEKEEHSYPWKSGQLFTYFHDWHIEQCTEFIFDCNSSGIPHRHANNLLYAKNLKEAHTSSHSTEC